MWNECIGVLLQEITNSPICTLHAHHHHPTVETHRMLLSQCTADSSPILHGHSSILKGSKVVTL